jgi:hypothetical protein
MPQMGIIGGYHFVNVTQMLRDTVICAAMQAEVETVMGECAVKDGATRDKHKEQLLADAITRTAKAGGK